MIRLYFMFIYTAQMKDCTMVETFPQKVICFKMCLWLKHIAGIYARRKGLQQGTYTTSYIFWESQRKITVDVILA